MHTIPLIEFILYVKDQEASKEFYKKVFEDAPDLHVPGMTEFMLAPNVKLGLMPESGIQKLLNNKVPVPASGNGIPRCELYLYVENPEQYLTRALNSGATAISECLPRDWGDIAGYCADIDGHVLAFAKKK